MSFEAIFQEYAQTVNGSIIIPEVDFILKAENVINNFTLFFSSTRVVVIIVVVL